MAGARGFSYIEFFSEQTCTHKLSCMTSDFQFSRQVLQNPRMGRRWVIPDIHGFAKTFKALVNEKIQLTVSDQLFLLGDYLDRGPDSVGVIDFILELQKFEYQVLALRGNHEESFLSSYASFHTGVYQKFFLQMVEVEKFETMLDNHKKMRPVYENFFNSLPYYFELDHFYLVHAGFRFIDTHLLNDYDAMTTMRRFAQNPTDKTIVHGHEITDLSVIEHKIQSRSCIIPLDNGCYYGPVIKSMNLINHTGKLHRQVGKLLALNLDTFELLEQENID